MSNIGLSFTPLFFGFAGGKPTALIAVVGVSSFGKAEVGESAAPGPWQSAAVAYTSAGRQAEA